MHEQVFKRLELEVGKFAGLLHEIMPIETSMIMHLHYYTWIDPREATGQQRSFKCLLQCVSMAVQRGNTAEDLGSMKGATDLGWAGLWLGFIFV